MLLYWVLKLTYESKPPADGDTSGIFDALKALGGQDATDILSKVDDESNPHPAKMALEALKTQHQSRVVERVEMPLPNVSLADLAEHSDPADGGAWVAIGDNVWDMACK